ncbi:MAG: flagellin lysine-N-methylase, partial [Eubacterium sp.]
MKLYTPKYYKDFLCLAGHCPDTCCAGWDVVIDEPSQACYHRTPGPFGARLKAEMQEDEDGDIIFKAAGGRCPFLSDANLCDIYSTLGEPALSETCRLYPRYFNDYGPLQEAGLALSCPEAARLILENPDPITFDSIDAICPHTPEETPDTKLLDRLVKARKTGIILLQNRSLPYHERLALLLDHSVRLTAGLFTSDPQQEQQLCRQYEKPKSLTLRLSAIKSNNHFCDNDLLTAVLELLKKCEHRTTAFTQQIDAALGFLNTKPTLSASDLWPIRPTQSHYPEHIGVYTLHRYFLESVFTWEPLIQAQHTAMA